MRLLRASLCHAHARRARSLLQLVAQSHQDGNRRQHACGDNPALRRSSFPGALPGRRPIPEQSAPRVIAITQISEHVNVTLFRPNIHVSASHF
jgi:hypothetical protein